MILELATIDVKPGMEPEFERAFGEARKILAAQTGHRANRLQRCIEAPARYLLQVEWATLEDHTEGFRNSADFARWRELVGPFFVAPPSVVHYAAPLGASA